MISNFLSNAIKYSTPGKLIEVRCEEAESEIHLSVSDQGRGIDFNDISKLFERYYRVQSQDHQHIAGFGIGLYLSAEIIERHNGKIWAESEIGKGSTFHYKLPLK